MPKGYGNNNKVRKKSKLKTEKESLHFAHELIFFGRKVLWLYFEYLIKDKPNLKSLTYKPIEANQFHLVLYRYLLEPKFDGTSLRSNIFVSFQFLNENWSDFNEVSHFWLSLYGYNFVRPSVELAQISENCKVPVPQ